MNQRQLQFWLLLIASHHLKTDVMLWSSSEYPVGCMRGGEREGVGNSIEAGESCNMGRPTNQQWAAWRASISCWVSGGRLQPRIGWLRNVWVGFFIALLDGNAHLEWILQSCEGVLYASQTSSRSKMLAVPQESIRFFKNSDCILWMLNGEGSDKIEDRQTAEADFEWDWPCLSLETNVFPVVLIKWVKPWALSRFMKALRKEELVSDNSDKVSDDSNKVGQ